MASATLILLEIIIAILLSIYLYFKWSYTYWSRMNIKHIVPSFPFGTMKAGKESYGDMLKRAYFELKAKDVRHGGIYLLHRPIWVPLDTDIVKQILNNSFAHFVNHGFYFNQKDDPLSMSILNIEDEHWKDLRSKLSPVFTSGKMKNMFSLSKAYGDELNKYFLEAAESKMKIDIKDVVTRYTTDSIGSSAFGVSCNSIKTSDSEFIKYGKMVFEDSTVRSIIATMVPRKVLTFLKFKSIKPKLTKFFMNLVQEIVEYREKNNIYVKDLLHLLIQLKNIGKLTDDGALFNKSEEQRGIISLDILAAQSFIFFVGGFETSASTLQFAVYEMAKNQAIQNKLRAEILSILNEEELTYDKLSELKYTEKVIEEALRMYPPFPLLSRVCNKDFRVPGTNDVIKSGTLVNIPTWGMQMDEEYFPNPYIFNPENFSEENKAKRPKQAWLPFGEGPRHCIGLRFAVLQMKIALVSIFKDFKITLSQQYPDILKMDASSLVTGPAETLYVKATKI